MSTEEKGEGNESTALDAKKRITFFSSFEEMEEHNAREAAAIPPETHLRNASERAKRIFSYDAHQPMNKTIKFKDGHSD